MVGLGIMLGVLSSAIGLSPSPTVLPSPENRTQIETVRIVHGAGAAVKKSDVVRIHFSVYSGDRLLMDTRKTGLAYSFLVGDVEEPVFLTQAAVGLKAGGLRECRVPWELAGGTKGLPPALPPQTDLRVTVKLVQIVRPGVESGS